MTVAFMVLTTASAWAGNMSYYDPTAASDQQNKSADATAITSDMNSIGIAGQTTWYYVSGEVTCNNRIEVLGTVNIILVDGCSFTASRGIRVNSNFALNIYAQKAGTGCGSLTAESYASEGCGVSAAIGGDGGMGTSGNTADDGETSGPISIYGGTITANGTIGGGNGGFGASWTDGDDANFQPGKGGNGGDGNVNIYGGVITINGNIGGGDAGPGEPDEGECGGGTVNLTWTNTTDRIQASCYYGKVKLNHNFRDANNNAFTTAEYTGDDEDISYDNYNQCALNGVTLIPTDAVYTIGYDGNCLDVNPSPTIEGATVTLTAINGYTVSNVTVTLVNSNGNVDVTDNHDGTWTFTMPADHVVVDATATKTHYEIATADDVDLSVNENDILVQNGKTYYRVGATIPFTVIPMAENFELCEVRVYHTDGDQTEITPSQSGSTYSFTMPAADVTISPSWLQTSFTISKEDNMTLNVSDGGTETIGGNVYYKQGATITVKVTPPAGQMVSELRVNDSTNGVIDNGNDSFTFTMPGDDVTLSAVYTLNTRGLTLLTGTSAFTVTGGISGVDGLDTGNPKTIKYNINSEDRGEGCTRLLDGKYSSTDESDYSKWCVDGFGLVSVEGQPDYYYLCKTNPLYVEFNTAQPVIPKMYVLITGNDNSSYPGRNPKNWKILAKVNADDQNWETIAEATGDCSMDDVNFTAYTFDFNNPNDKAYQYFRFEISGTRGTIVEEYGEEHEVYDVMQLSEMQMWVKNSEELTMNASGIMTYAGNKDLDFTGINGLKAYIVSDFNGTASTLTLTPAGAVPAGTGLLLKGTPSTTFYVPFAASASAPTTNYLHGVTSSTTEVPVTDGDNTNFILANGKYGIDWYTLSEAGAIGANKAYLSLPTASLNFVNGAPGFTWVYDGEETTGVNEVLTPEGMSVARNNDNSWFTLSGTRLDKQPTQKGVYIHGGQKVVIK